MPETSPLRCVTSKERAMLVRQRSLWKRQCEKHHQRRHSASAALGPPNPGCLGLLGDVPVTSVITAALGATWCEGQHADEGVPRLQELCDSEQVRNLSGPQLFLHELARTIGKPARSPHLPAWLDLLAHRLTPHGPPHANCWLVSARGIPWMGLHSPAGLPKCQSVTRVGGQSHQPLAPHSTIHADSKSLRGLLQDEAPRSHTPFTCFPLSSILLPHSLAGASRNYLPK